MVEWGRQVVRHLIIKLKTRCHMGMAQMLTVDNFFFSLCGFHTVGEMFVSFRFLFEMTKLLTLSTSVTLSSKHPASTANVFKLLNLKKLLILLLFYRIWFHFAHLWTISIYAFIRMSAHLYEILLCWKDLQYFLTKFSFALPWVGFGLRIKDSKQISLTKNFNKRNG